MTRPERVSTTMPLRPWSTTMAAYRPFDETCKRCLGEPKTVPPSEDSTAGSSTVQSRTSTPVSRFSPRKAPSAVSRSKCPKSAETVRASISGAAGHAIVRSRQAVPLVAWSWPSRMGSKIEVPWSIAHIGAPADCHLRDPEPVRSIRPRRLPGLADTPRRGSFGYLGLIGSKPKRERFVRRLHERGIPPDRAERDPLEGGGSVGHRRGWQAAGLHIAKPCPPQRDRALKSCVGRRTPRRSTSSRPPSRTVRPGWRRSRRPCSTPEPACRTPRFAC